MLILDQFFDMNSWQAETTLGRLKNHDFQIQANPLITQKPPTNFRGKGDKQKNRKFMGDILWFAMPNKVVLPMIAFYPQTRTDVS